MGRQRDEVAAIPCTGVVGSRLEVPPVTEAGEILFGGALTDADSGTAA
jgi:hypothetical protein